MKWLDPFVKFILASIVDTQYIMDIVASIVDLMTQEVRITNGTSRKSRSSKLFSWRLDY